jgi:hypothetical protein
LSLVDKYDIISSQPSEAAGQSSSVSLGG